METIIIKRKISSPQLRISELKDFIGKYVEIIVRESKPDQKISSEKLAAGLLTGFKDKEKSNLESQAWKMMVDKKHGNN